VNAWIVDPRSIFNSTLPRIDAVRARSLEQLRSLEDDPVQGLPWALTVAASLPVALLVGVPTAGIGIGVVLGLFITGGAALYMRARQREAAASLARAIVDIHADADRRVEIVTRQYEWAVNDVANLRDALRRARAQIPARTDVQDVSLTRRLSDTDPSTTLRFAAQGIAPEQVRILNNGVVVAISARALEAASAGEDAVFTIRMSEYIAEALRGGNPAYRIEALINEHWRTVELRPAHDTDLRTTEVRDKRGRVYRVPVEDAPHVILTLPVAELS
jgi:hypothetical protein